MYKKFYKFNIKTLLKIRLHLGHKDSSLDLNLTSYIYGTRHNISIYCLDKLWKPYRYLYYSLIENFSRRNCFFIVGTNPNLLLKPFLEFMFQTYSEKSRKQEFYISGYVDKKWVGGLFTNWKLFRQFIPLIDRPLETFKKKYRFFKYFDSLHGLKNLSRMPIPDFVVVLHNDKEALKELNKFQIPLIGLVDSDMNPNNFIFKFFGNNDSLKNIKFFFKFIKEAVEQGRLKEQFKFCNLFIMQIKKRLNNEI